MSTMTLTADAAPRPRSRIVAALLTLIAPGAGHFYIGRRRRGVAIIVLNFVLLAAFISGAFFLPPLFLPLAIYGVAGLAVGALYYLGATIDAVRLTRRDGAAQPVRWYVLVGLIAVIWACSFAFQLAGPVLKQHLPWQTYSVSSSSMMPTLQAGESFIADPRHYATHAPARDDVVVYRLAGGERTVFVKRVIGLPGDRIAFRDNRAIVNGMLQTEPFANLENPVAPLATTTEMVVPPDHVFVAGDNRANSSDSRVTQHGFVPVTNLIGRATEIVTSHDFGRLGRWIGTPGK